VDCVYPKNPPKIIPQSLEDSVDDGPELPILDLIPEANILQPQMMLTLSKQIFMNHSPDIPSPWPHWSEYASELASEPSIYHTAFKDFHRLALSVTKRLVQTSIIQATSRLRAQRRRRDDKGLSPFVKTRDVIAAIDILGLRRNGSERWKGVARRCGLRVIGHRRSPQSRKRREISWEDVERILTMTMPLDETHGTENVRSRAERRGTPLPMQDLTLSDPEESLEDDDDDAFSDEGTNSDDVDEDDERPADLPCAESVVQLRDDAGRFRGASLAPLHHTFTLENIDQEARQQGERAIRTLFGLPSSIKDDPLESGIENEADLELDTSEKIYTDSNNWRASIEYRAPWEEFDAPPTAASFLANQKPNGQVAAARVSSTDGDSSSSSSSRQRRLKSRAPTELRVHGTNAYAALQGADAIEQNSVLGSSSGDEEMEADMPTQSIEVGVEEMEDERSADESSEDEMDWD
jgi:RNA polymerase I-specific transcription initiation factor RRN5